MTEVEKAVARLEPQYSFAEIGKEIGDLVATKNAAYGSSFDKAGDIMRIFYPHGVTHDQVDDALTVVRVLDKLFRIATDRDALGESPWQDIAGYALLSVRRQRLIQARRTVQAPTEKLKELLK